MCYLSGPNQAWSERVVQVGELAEHMWSLYIISLESMILLS